MKNEIKLFGIAVTLIVASFCYTQVYSPRKLDNLLLENIDALAAGEGSVGGECIGAGSIICPFNNEGVAHVRIYYSSFY
ncbi:hypothetical protein [Bacteroides graminisolvens]|uniref:hypothetical protein n=1 Tax=Bacteroides graminisolvens TaxID=477666 RepID=UPI000401339F|nr:hypothetical protein [Bacteroides graminisolvens]